MAASLAALGLTAATIAPGSTQTITSTLVGDSSGASGVVVETIVTDPSGGIVLDTTSVFATVAANASLPVSVSVPISSAAPVGNYSITQGIRSASSTLTVATPSNVTIGTAVPLTGAYNYVLVDPPLTRAFTVAVPSGSVKSLSTVTGLVEWWDASSLSDTTQTPAIVNMLSPTSAPVNIWSSPVGSVVSKGSGGHALTVSGTGQVAWPKLVATSGGIGNPGNYLRYVAWHWPVMHPDNSLAATPGFDFGSAQNWSLMLVWSRPNTRQAATGQTIAGTGPSGAVTLLTIGTTAVLQMGGAGIGADTLNLLPASANASLGTMTRRHTHTLILTNTSGSGMTAVLDGVQVASGVSATALGTSNTGAMLFMAENGATNGSAQLWFHEAAVWNRPLGSTDLSAVDAILTTRYPNSLRGNRKGIALLGNGQSNAAFMYSTANATPFVTSGLAYQMGVLAVTLLNDDQAHNSTTYQLVSSTGIADRADGGGFLNNIDAPGPTFNPATWPAGSPDLAVQTNINALSAADQAEIAGAFWYWGENDSANWFYGDKATYNAIVKRQLQVERGYVTAVQPSASAATLPVLMMPVPYGAFNNGAPMIREVYTDLTTDGASNFYTYLQTFDSFSRTDSGYNATNGQWTFDATNAAHRADSADQKMARRVTPALANMLMSSGHHEFYTSLPAGVMKGQGPQITSVVRDATNPALLHLTIQHDGGTDLIVSQGASFGHGFSVSQGVPSSNTQLFCNNWASGGAIGSVTRIDATHLDVLFPSSTAGYTTLYYPYPSLETSSHMVIGPGNAVTDNWMSVAPPGWNLTEIGFPAENYPLQMPGYGIPIN